MDTAAPAISSKLLSKAYVAKATGGSSRPPPPPARPDLPTPAAHSELVAFCWTERRHCPACGGPLGKAPGAGEP